MTEFTTNSERSMTSPLVTRGLPPGASSHKRRRIAHVLLSSQIGGGEMATWRVAQALEEDGEFQSVAFCKGRDTEVARLFIDQGLETAYYESSEYSYRHPLPFIASALRISRELRRRKIDLVHCSDILGAYYAGLAAKLGGIPIVCHIRSNFEQIPMRLKPPLMTVNRFAFVSQETWRNFNNIFRVPPERGRVIYDWAPEPLDYSDPTLVRARVRHELGIPEDAPVFGMVARVAPQKDFESLILATVDVLKTRPEAMLVLVGENDEPDSCRDYHRRLCKLIDNIGLSGKVIWTGFRRDVAELMQSMDVVVLSTRSEGFPLTLLEAMAVGRPVVTTRVGGIPEIISDGENGLLHEVRDAKGLGRQILRVLEDKDLARVISDRGRETVSKRFTKARTLHNIKQLYAGLLSYNGRGRKTAEREY